MPDMLVFAAIKYAEPLGIFALYYSVLRMTELSQYLSVCLEAIKSTNTHTHTHIVTHTIIHTQTHPHTHSPIETCAQTLTHDSFNNIRT